MKKGVSLVILTILTLFAFNTSIFGNLYTFAIDSNYSTDDTQYFCMEDWTSLSDWSQCNGDPDYESSIIANLDPRHTYEYDVESVNGSFTPENITFKTDYWSDENIGDHYQHAGIYREELTLNNSLEWVINLTISIDPNFADGLSSFAGGIFINIDNENKEPMLQVNVGDPSGVPANHRLSGLAYYYDSNDTRNEFLHTANNDVNNIIESGNFALKKNVSGLYVFFPSEIPGDLGWRYLGNEALLLQRGTPTFIRLDFRKWYVRPNIIRIENIEYYALVQMQEPIDNIKPTIDHISDLILEYSNASYTLVWHPYDLNPSCYTLLLNGSQLVTASWNGSMITFDTSISTLGVYNYTLIVYDQNGNFASDSILITIIDTTIPFIIPTSDISMYENETETIKWIITEENPSTYRILRNNEVIQSGEWHGSNITIELKDLSPGVYFYTLYVIDECGNDICKFNFIHNN
ncbi:MAG: hypothetical protein ACTSPG_07675 [Candidatus Hodarchaeales archaeon]